ncbi:type II secretion system protein [Lentisphaera marina]|uniref:type II secretion system protein n=1 Tax=Lentisphaera marina TaxID=1111041 RepID=UPI002366D196|nr:type II secretion system protein [Lentisphaera marina]MDD7984683.1 type II secretion system protein [Lentisphaera marina]
MVVIAIISILATMLLPSLKKAKAEQVGSMSNHKQLGLAVAMYGNDLRGYLPWYKAGDANNARAHAMYFTLPIYVNGGGADETNSDREYKMAIAFY